MVVKSFKHDYNVVLGYILLFSLLLKVVLLYAMGAQPFLDGRGYMKIAEKIYLSGWGYPADEIKDAPLTPYVYSLLYPFSKLVGIKAFALGNIILATLTIVLGYKISLEIFERREVAFTTALLFAIYPFFNFYAITILTETIYIFFLYAALLFAVRFLKYFSLRDIIWFSFIFALSTLTRFADLSMFPFFLLLFLIFMLRSGKSPLSAGRMLLVAIAVFFLTMTPWWIRNYSVHGEFVATSVGESGKVFYSGNNPKNQSGGGIGKIDVDFSSFEHIQDLKERDRAMWKAGIEWIKENPRDWMVLEIKKLIRFYSPIFYAEQYNKWYYNLISVLSYGIIFLLFLYSLFQHRTKFLYYSPLLLYTVLLTAVHLVFIASLRYRLPLEPFMIIMAAPIITQLLVKKRFEKN